MHEHSFPTRRSSDLVLALVSALPAAWRAKRLSIVDALAAH
jgi:hypothetical protein